MARKKKHEEHENHERWLVSYADFITLLFAFFVVMYSISSVNEGKYRVLSDAMISAFSKAGQSIEPIMIGNPSSTTQTINRSSQNTPIAMGARKMPIPTIRDTVNKDQQSQIMERDASSMFSPEGQTSPEDGMQATSDDPNQTIPGGEKPSIEVISEEIESSLATMINNNLVTLRRHSNALEVELKSNVLFKPGSAVLSVPSEKILIKLALIISRFPNAVQVEGHTDDSPVASAIYPSNWQLSASRAASVVQLFSEHGLDPENLWAVGYGQHRPLVANDTEEHRRSNRRVVMWIRTPERKQPAPKSETGDAQLNKIPETGIDAPGSAPETAPGSLNFDDPGALNNEQPAIDNTAETVITEEPVETDTTGQAISPIQLPSPTGFKPFTIPGSQPVPQPAEGGQ